MQHIIKQGKPSQLFLEIQFSRRFISGDKNSPVDMSNYVFGHDRTEQYFYIRLKDPSGECESLAILQYSWVKPGHVDLYHTEVPTDLQRQGIAKHLVLAGLYTFSMENMVIRPSCTYVQKVLRENPLPLYINHLDKG
ncbi:protein NATD1-like [Physella acuta]|uniref:protein NATD1-like n=1 Tax=Physella acuta TaxID=109671 RepID=UPI0027DC77DE|nr:protein NATD1-like [Physella acuta]